MRNALASHGFWQAVLSLSVPVIAWFGGAPWPVVVILSAVVLVVVTLGIIHQVTLRRSVHRTAELYHELTGLDLACRGIGLRYYLLCMRRAMHDMARLLAEARQNQALVVDAMMDLEHGVALLDKSGVIQAVNQRGAAMLGLAVGRRLWEEKSGAMALFEIVEKSLKIGQSCSGDFQTVLPEKRWFHLDALALPDGRLLLVFDDMTTTREVAETKSRLVSAVSHELRTPLTVIAGYLEMAQDAGAKPQDRERALETAARHTARLSALVEDLLTLSRMESVPLRREPTDIKALLHEAADLLVPRAKQKGLALRLEISEDIGVAEVDRNMLQAAVFNLLDNAVKFTEAGQVELSARLEGPMLVVVVSDTGPGISADDLPRIFERFYKARLPEGAETQGTGLGLAIVKWAAAAHGGDVSVESRVGAGSRFTVRVPVRGA